MRKKERCILKYEENRLSIYKVLISDLAITDSFTISSSKTAKRRITHSILRPVLQKIWFPPTRKKKKRITLRDCA